MNSYLDDWSFRLQRFCFPRRTLFSLSGERFVFMSSSGDFLCGLLHVDFGLKQWAFCVTQIFPKEPAKDGAAIADELRAYILSHRAKECLVIYSPSGWPKDAFLLQKDGIIWADAP